VCYGTAARGTRESLGCCATNGSAAVPAAAAIASVLLNASGGVSGEELLGLLQGAQGQLPGPLTSLGGVDAGRGAALRCEPFAPFTAQLTHRARAASAAAHSAGLSVRALQCGRPPLLRLASAPSHVCERTPTPPHRLTELNVNEPRGQTTSLKAADAGAVRRIAWANVGAREASPPPGAPLVLWASSEKASNGRHVSDELGVVKQVRQHLARAWPVLELMHLRLPELSFAQEVRLMRRAAVFISLFGSALHNCRWMRPGADHVACPCTVCSKQHSTRATHTQTPTRTVATLYLCVP